MPEEDFSPTPTPIAASRNEGPHQLLNQPPKRPTAPVYPVWHPDGHMELHTRANCNDLVRLGTISADGKVERWSYSPPPGGQPAPSAPTGDKAGAAPAAAADAADEADAAGERAPTPKLDALRVELVSLGAKADPSWGIKRLEREIAEVRAAVVAGSPPPVPAHLRADADADNE